MTHTPGPWRVIEKVGFSVYPEDSPVYIAFMNNARSNCEANANLMAVAPEMLRELEDLREEFEGLRNIAKNHSKPIHFQESALEKYVIELDEIIAKAKGE